MEDYISLGLLFTLDSFLWEKQMQNGWRILLFWFVALFQHHEYKRFHRIQAVTYTSASTIIDFDFFWLEIYIYINIHACIRLNFDIFDYQVGLPIQNVGTTVLYTQRLSRLAKKAEQVELSYELWFISVLC